MRKKGMYFSDKTKINKAKTFGIHLLLKCNSLRWVINSNVQESFQLSIFFNYTQIMLF